MVYSSDAASQVDPGEFRSGALSWYAVHVRTNFERTIAQVLHGKGYEEYLPVYRARHQWSDRLKHLELPLFPGYLFLRIDIALRLLPILTTPGVLRIVSAGKRPVPVPNREIDAVRAVLRSSLPVMPWPKLCAGSRVSLERGPLAGLEGTVLDANRKYRLVVSIPLLQRGVAVEIDREWVRPVSNPVRDPGSVVFDHSLRRSKVA